MFVCFRMLRLWLVGYVLKDNFELDILGDKILIGNFIYCMGDFFV